MVGSNVLGSGTYYKAERSIINEGYSNPPYANDIGLVRIAGTLQLNDNVQPISYSNKDVSPGTQVKTTGWGPDQQQLQTVQQEILSNAECKTMYGEGNPLDESHICAFSKHGQALCNVRYYASVTFQFSQMFLKFEFYTTFCFSLSNIFFIEYRGTLVVHWLQATISLEFLTLSPFRKIVISQNISICFA